MSNAASILSDLRPCGYVLATSQYKYFALKCLYCDKNYGQWATFLQHLRELHMGVEDETQWLVEYPEDALEPQVESKRLTTVDCHTHCVDVDMETNDRRISPNQSELNKKVNESEDISEESQADEDVNAESAENVLVVHSDIENSLNKSIYEEDMNDSQGDLHFNMNQNPISPESFTQEINIDLKVENVATHKFIEIYQFFPTLWSMKNFGNNTNRKQCLAKKDILRAFAEQNMLISTSNLEESLSELRRQYIDIARRLEEGIEISAIEENYLKACSFLESYAKSVLEQGPITETESESSFVGQSENESSNEKEYNYDTQSGCDLSDDGIDTLQDKRQTSVVKFSTRNNITRDFIQCFRDQPCLWNPHDPAYNDFKERRQAIIKIKDFFLNNYSLQLTEGKINSDIKRLYIFYKRCYYSCRDLNTIRKYYYERCKFLADAELDNMHLIRSNGYKKISFSVSDEFTLGFIDFCAMHPVLWDKSHPNYSVLNIRKKAYEEIAANLQHIYNVEFSHDELYYAISRLKQHFYNLQQKKILNESLTKDEQDFIARCNFLPQSDYNLQCHICERILRSNATLQTHLLKVHNIGELPHKCDYCEQRFAQRSIKREHQIRAHTKEFEWFCPYCAKGFANRRDMEMHQMVHTGERKSICEHCGKGFRLKHQMTEHVKIMHERLRRFKCTMCPKDFLRKRQLDDHIRTHLNIRDKICNICGKGFTNMHGLFRHKLLHSDVKRYECKVCGERFRLISGLSSHKKRKHKTFKQQVISTNVFIEEEEGEDENANGK
ncbi:PREDICTED: uncharacterized protein LOC108359504 isoform X2 [Rhagoletis zephyria]|uniref:uncharacterized protein LOC108359504 isoform X2 n=1 Tax=Rhagoletis zephyria TaxID=28612 RepID=UPI0008112FC8|nr:PREDICTED: uncharacterized protein LOC108359504 isoform X2 [Rhagoletis zephyria]